MDFSTSMKEQEYIDKVKQFINDIIKPNISDWYKNENFPRPILVDLYKTGLMGFHRLEHKWEWEPMTYSIILYEKLSELSPGIAISILVHCQLGLYTLCRWGNIWQQQEFMLPGVKGQKIICFATTEGTAGSDSVDIKLQAQKEGDGYLLNGEKIYITNGHNADTILVTAVTNQKAIEKKFGISLFVLDGTTQGIERKRLIKNVWTPSNLAKLTFKDCFVPSDNIIGQINNGFHIMMKVFNSSRIALSALTLGTSMGAYKLALSHACKRKVFDIPIIEHQAKSFEFAEKLTRLEASRLLIKKAAWMRDSGQKYILNSSMANFYSSETARDITRWASEILGANAILAENPIHRYTMDVMGSALMAGSSDIQKLIISRFMHTWDNWEY